MTIQLPEDQQKMYDGMWNNMLTPVKRVDRQTLLDTVTTYMMINLGVDRLRLTSEKYLPGGKVVMEVDCDRASPWTDQFSITVLNDRGQTLRRERYTRQEVEESANLLALFPNASTSVQVTIHAEIGSTQPATRPDTQPATEPCTQPAETPEERRLRLECERRAKAVEAATRPATVR